MMDKHGKGPQFCLLLIMLLIVLIYYLLFLFLYTIIRGLVSSPFKFCNFFLIGVKRRPSLPSLSRCLYQSLSYNRGPYADVGRADTGDSTLFSGALVSKLGFQHRSAWYHTLQQNWHIGLTLQSEVGNKRVPFSSPFSLHREMQIKTMREITLITLDAFLCMQKVLNDRSFLFLIGLW